jgi:hypothetical protein
VIRHYWRNTGERKIFRPFSGNAPIIPANIHIYTISAPSIRLPRHSVVRDLQLKRIGFMGRRKTETTDSGFFLVNVVYEDGTQRSNRKVMQSQMTGFDDVADIRSAIEAQDEKIAEMSGQPRLPIASITRVKGR